MAGEIEARLKELGIDLPAASNPVANYVPTVQAGQFLFVSGQIAKAADGTVMTGSVGGDVTVEEGQKAARLCALNILAQAKAALGSLDRIRQVVRLTGFVNSGAGFADHPKVVNGASDFFVQVFGDAGRHARSAVGMGSLPFGVAVEVEAVAEIRP